MIVSKAELDLIRQWFDAVEDLNPAYLEPKDYALATRVAAELGTRPPKMRRTRPPERPASWRSKR